MGRPRKNANTPDASKRILDAFWKLLETHSLRDITVGMIVHEAGCNRGTFYYHYADMGALVSSAVEEELLGEKGLSVDVFDLATGVDDIQVVNIFAEQRMGRFSLLMRKGGRDAVERTVKRVAIEMWSAVMCTDGEELKPEARILIEYATSGILGIVSCVDEMREKDAEVEVELNYVSQMARYTVRLAAEAQGMSADEVMTRLKILNQFNRASQR